MFCRECGKKVEEGNKYCTGCGAKIEPIKVEKIHTLNENSNNEIVNNASNEIKEDKVSIGFNILSFFFPIVGLIMFLVYKNETPRRAKSIGMSAIIGYIVINVLSVLFAIWLNFFIIKHDNIHRYNDYRYDKNYRYDYQYRYNI